MGLNDAVLGLLPGLLRFGLLGRGGGAPPQRPPSGEAPSPAGWRLLWLAPAAVVIALYGRSVRGAAFVLDDDDFIAPRTSLDGLAREWTANVAAAAGDERASSVWRPLVTSLWRVLGAVFGADPALIRALNVGLQALDAVLVAACARALGVSPVVAAGLGVAWGVHAASVDVVAWGVGGFDLVSTGCALGAVWLLARARAAEGPRVGEPGGGPLGDGPRGEGARGGGALGGGTLAVAAAVAVAAAALAKESGVALGLLLPLLFGRRALLCTVAAVLVAGAHARVTGTAATDALADPARLVAAWVEGFGWLAAPPARGLLAGFEPWAGAPMAVATFVLVGSLAAGAAWAGSPRAGAPAWLYKRAALALLAAGIVLAPTAVAVVSTGVAPARYAHLPAALALVLLAPVIAALPRRAGLALAVGWLVLHVPAAVVRLPDWASERALLDAEVALDPDNALARAWRGRDRATTCEIAGVVEWATALERDPGFVFLREDRYALAQRAFLCGRPDIAEAAIARYLADRPDAAPNAWCIHADALDALGRPDEAAVAARSCR